MTEYCTIKNHKKFQESGSINLFFLLLFFFLCSIFSWFHTYFKPCLYIFNRWYESNTRISIDIYFQLMNSTLFLLLIEYSSIITFFWIFDHILEQSLLSVELVASLLFTLDSMTASKKTLERTFSRFLLGSRIF